MKKITRQSSTVLSGSWWPFKALFIRYDPILKNQIKFSFIFNEYHLYKILVQLHITKNSGNIFKRLEFTSLSYKEALSHVPCAVQGWYTSFIILWGIKGLLSGCFLSLNCHSCLYTSLKQQEVYPFFPPSRKNIKRKLSICWPCQPFSEASPRSSYLHFIHEC